MLKHKLDSPIIPLIAAITSIGAILSPLPIQAKLPIGLISMGTCTHQAIKEKGKRDRLLRFREREGQELEAKRLALEAKQEELEESLNVLAIAEIELSAKRQRWEIEEREAREAFKAELSRKEDDLLLRLEREEWEHKSQLETALEANKKAILAQMNSDIKEVQAVLDALERERQEKLDQIEAERLQRLELIEIELTREREKWEAQRGDQQEKDQQELEQAKQDLIDAYLEQKDVLQTQLEQLREQLQSEAKANFESWLVPHCQEMNDRIKEVEALKGTIQMLREQMAEDRDIRLCNEFGTVHGDRANALLTWLKGNAVYCDYVSSTILPDGTFVLNFEPWEVGSKAEKKIKGLLLACQVRFGLQEPPLFEPNGEARSWCFKMFPARARASFQLEQFYVQGLPETNLGESFRDLEPALREGVARQLNYQEQVAEMMTFKPPVPLPAPRSRQLTELEVMCFRWFYFWRGLATEGLEENVTTREGLLYSVYGVREGRRSTTYDPILGESLGKRVKRVIQMFEAEKTAMDLEDLEEVDDE